MSNVRQGRAAVAPFDYPFDGVYTEPFDPSTGLRTGFTQDRLRRSAQDELRTGKVAGRS